MEVRLGRVGHGGGLLRLGDSNMEVHYIYFYVCSELPIII